MKGHLEGEASVGPEAWERDAARFTEEREVGRRLRGVQVEAERLGGAQGGHRGEELGGVGLGACALADGQAAGVDADDG